MKSMILKTALAVMAGASLVSCGDFGDINENPNKPTTAYTSYLFSSVTRHTPYIWNDERFTSDRTSAYYNPVYLMYPQYIAERQNVQYGTMNLFTGSTIDTYRYVLKNLKDIVDMNSNDATKNQVNVSSFGSSNNQIGVARTLMGYFYLHMTDIFGMIPYSEALQGEANLTPKLDTQEEIYKGVLTDMKEAYDLMDASSSLNATYDNIYKGDVEKWKKLNATVRLLAAIKLSDVDPENGKKWFVEAYNDGAIEDNADNFVYKYYANTDNENPLYSNVYTNGRRDFAPNKAFVDTLNVVNDPRRQVYFTKNAAGEYKGIPLGIKSADVANYNKDNSNFAEAMLAQDAPLTMYSAARVLLVEAEAAVRGWINADAKSLYEKAIATSFSAKGLTYTDDVLQNYLAQDGVKFQGTDDNKIQLIAKQRWINGYFEDGVEAWSDWRRLDYPIIVTGPYSKELGINHVPYRMPYGSSDRSATPTQYEEADKIQGPDLPDTRVWWDVKDNREE